MSLFWFTNLKKIIFHTLQVVDRGELTLFKSVLQGLGSPEVVFFALELEAYCQK